MTVDRQKILYRIFAATMLSIVLHLFAAWHLGLLGWIRADTDFSQQATKFSATLGKPTDGQKKTNKFNRISVPKITKPSSPEKTKQMAAASGYLIPPELVWVEPLNIENLISPQESGSLDLEIIISPDGKAIRVSRGDSNLPESFFTIAAPAFASATYLPGRFNGVPITDKLSIRIVFQAAEVPPENEGKSLRTIEE